MNGKAQYLARQMVVICVLLALCQAIDAGVIRAPVGVTANDFGEFSSSFPITDLINQSGLSAPYTSGVTNFETYNATHDDDASFDWVSDNPVSLPGNIDFDLGAEFMIDKLALWNDAQIDPEDRGINEFTVFTDDNSAFSSPTNVGSFSAIGFETGSSAKQVFDLTDSLGRYLRLRITSNHGDNVMQAGEIAVSIIPEPSSLVLLAAGAWGFICRRRSGSPSRGRNVSKGRRMH